MFALAMDYSVFLLASTREQWDKHHDPEQATIEGVARSGRVIFAAAGIMIAVFITFAAVSFSLPPKEMGTILAASILIEAGPVRMLLMPVILRLAGKHAWRAPPCLDRILPNISWAH